jgi:hypothetical protein
MYGPDFPAIFERFDVEDYVNNQGVQEIWFWNGPLEANYPSYDPAIHDPINFRMLWESNMSSPVTGDISNSNRRENDLPVYDKTYVVYGYNFRRTHAEAVHCHGHQLEQQLAHVNKLQDGNSHLFWQEFVGLDSSGNMVPGRCGCTHFPPNTTSDYDYCNSALMESDIEDWIPDGLGETKLVNCATWGDLVFNWPEGETDFTQRVETQWYIYWMQSFPGSGNHIPYGPNVMTNWWEFIADWDNSITSGKGLYADPTGVDAPEAQGTPSRVILYPAYPNPFNPATTISYRILESSKIRIAVYDVSGRLVNTLMDDVQTAGEYSVFFDGRNQDGTAISSGVYFVRIESGGSFQSTKIILAK